MSSITPGPDRTVLITGAGSGIGLATAIEVARLGFVTVGLVPDEEGAERITEAAAEHGVVVPVVEVDLADVASRQQVVADVRPWALVNNAGYMDVGRLQDVPIDEARRQLEVMVLAPADLIRQALPYMVQQHDGRIINVTTAAVHASTPLTGWYQASKAALRELTDSLRIEVHGQGVKVIDVEPGGIRTAIWARGRSELHAHGRAPQRQADDVMSRRLAHFAPKMSDPADVGRAIGKLLTMSHPPRHLRIGTGARRLRLGSEIVPDVIWDQLVHGLVTALGAGRKSTDDAST